MTLYHWSKTAANNGTADVTCPFPEGMGAPALNDGARGMMAAVAKHRDDIAGAIVTGGTLNAYTVASFQVFDSLADMSGQMIAFTPHVTNGQTVTLNVDGLGAKPLRLSPGVELQSGILVAGTPYMANYNNSDGAWYLVGLAGNPYGIPLAGGMDYWGGTAPSSAFAFPIGQAISRVTYAALYSLLGNTYGAGDGVTTFNLPDKRGRVSAASDAGAGRITGAVFTGLGSGGVGGSESQTLIAAQIPTITALNPGSIALSVLSTLADWLRGGISDNYSSIAGFGTWNSPTKAQIASTGNIAANAIATTSNNTGGVSPSHPNVQPTIVCNYIIRIL